MPRKYWGETWWTWSGSNRRPLPCHGSALPAAPQAHDEGSVEVILTQLYGLVNQTLRWIPSCESCQSEYSVSEELKMNFRKSCAVFCCLFVLATASLAQTPAVSYTSIAELNQLLGNLQQASQAAQDDLSHMRIEKWKTDSGTKHQTEGNVESIQRNLQSALPGMLNDLKNSPENLALTFKVYRNLDALYDVTSSVVESAGAFGSKEEFQSLSKDLGALEDSRRAFADRMDKIATAKETELGQLRVALQNARAEIPPKKTVVDDTAPPAKKPAPRKKPTPKPAQPSSQTPPASSPPQ